MNRIVRRAFVSLVAVVTALQLAAVPGLAQQRVTLVEATAEALAKSDLLRAEDARVAGAAAAVEAARGNLLPTLTFEERFLATDNPAYDFSTKINQGNFTTPTSRARRGRSTTPTRSAISRRASRSPSRSIRAGRCSAWRWRAPRPAR